MFYQSDGGGICVFSARGCIAESRGASDNWGTQSPYALIQGQAKECSMGEGVTGEENIDKIVLEKVCVMKHIFYERQDDTEQTGQ